VKNGPARFWRYDYPPLRRSQSGLMLVLLQQLRLSLKGRFESPLKGFRDASPASSLPGHREWTQRSRRAPATDSSTHEPATSRAFRAANLAANAVIFGSEVDRVLHQIQAGDEHFWVFYGIAISVKLVNGLNRVPLHSAGPPDPRGARPEPLPQGPWYRGYLMSFWVRS